MPDGSIMSTQDLSLTTLPTEDLANRIHVVVDGEPDRDVVLQDGESVMQVIKLAGVDALLALCGGNLSCATCHVYIDPGFAGVLPDMSPEEDDLLDASPHRRPGSRLSCQIPCSDALAGCRVEVAPAE